MDGFHISAQPTDTWHARREAARAMPPARASCWERFKRRLTRLVLPVLMAGSAAGVAALISALPMWLSVSGCAVFGFATGALVVMSAGDIDGDGY